MYVVVPNLKENGTVRTLAVKFSGFLSYLSISLLFLKFLPQKIFSNREERYYVMNNIKPRYLGWYLSLVDDV